VVQPGGPFLGLDAGDAVELGELLAFLSDWLASDPDRLDASLSEFVGVPGYVDAVCTVDELRADVDRFARMLLGYDWGRAEVLCPHNAVGVVNHVGRECCSSVSRR
jgi:hypothetical protein